MVPEWLILPQHLHIQKWQRVLNLHNNTLENKALLNQWVQFGHPQIYLIELIRLFPVPPPAATLHPSWHFTIRQPISSTTTSAGQHKKTWGKCIAIVFLGAYTNEHDQVTSCFYSNRCSSRINNQQRNWADLTRDVQSHVHHSDEWTAIDGNLQGHWNSKRTMEKGNSRSSSNTSIRDETR